MTRNEYLVNRPSLVEEFNQTVMKRSDIIDPHKDEDWRSLAIGWGLAKGLDPECANIFANYIPNKKMVGE